MEGFKDVPPMCSSTRLFLEKPMKRFDRSRATTTSVRPMTWRTGVWIMMAGYRCTILVADAPGAASALLSKKPETATMNLLQRHMSGGFCMDYLSYLTWAGGVPVHSCKTRDTNAVAPAGGDKGIRWTKTLGEK